ncbi:MAG: hypothetical protein DMF93_05390 [Acidobacteria bacterium]|nr:MAG: hypothetical protein DMF93_05390 [Acidobacteriota bacterium]
MYFDFGSAIIKPESEPVLKEIAAALAKNPALFGAWVLCSAVAVVPACGGGNHAAPPARGTSPSTANTAPIDVCAIVTADDAKALFGPLPMQPPATTDNAGFGVRACMYIGPALSGAGAQTRFARLMVQAGRTKDAVDLLQADADRRKATVDFAGGGDAAKRSADGMFVWETKGGLSCTASIDVGLPSALTADTAAANLADLCRKIFAAAAR